VRDEIVPAGKSAWRLFTLRVINRAGEYVTGF
jgi:hypothetical protein